MTKEEFYARIEEAREGKVHKLTPELKKNSLEISYEI